jgi:hypothetical protein
MWVWGSMPGYRVTDPKPDEAEGETWCLTWCAACACNYLTLTDTCPTHGELEIDGTTVKSDA